jgi:hypothetical protein
MAIANRKFAHPETAGRPTADRTMAFVILMPGLVFWAVVIAVVIKFY